MPPDTARGFMQAGEMPGIEGEVFNLGTGHGITIGELAERLMAITGRDIPIECDDQRIRPPG